MPRMMREPVPADDGANVGELLEAVRRSAGADRVSVAELDLDAGDFAILAASGERLLPLGERHALDDSTHFSLAAEGRPSKEACKR